LVLLGILIWPSIRPAAGEEVAVMPDSEHISEGTDPGAFYTDPPTSGPHYATPLDAGLYEEADLEGIGPYPAGYLVHNLEHGYVIFWYNCDLVSESECGELKGQIKEVIEEANNLKVIGFPWSTTDVPVVVTSWGRLQRFETFDVEAANQYVRSNRNRAPEPQAP
jgi:hypothetical protein